MGTYHLLSVLTSKDSKDKNMDEKYMYKLFSTLERKVHTQEVTCDYKNKEQNGQTQESKKSSLYYYCVQVVQC
jgi:hypothetical protein